MKIRSFGFAFAVFLAVSCPVAGANEGKWQAMNQEMAAAIREGKVEEAIRQGEAVLAFAKETFGGEDLHTAKALNNLANLNVLKGDSGEAEKFYRQAIETQEKRLGKDHPDIADFMFNLGLLYANTGQPDKADAMLERVLAIKERTKGPEDPDTQRVRSALAELDRAG